MNIKQKESVFEPITITLETREEALGFLHMIDKVEHNRTSVPPKQFTTEEIRLAITISNAFTDGIVNL